MTDRDVTRLLWLALALLVLVGPWLIPDVAGLP